LVAVACIMIIPLFFMNRDSILLIPFVCTLALSTIYSVEGENPPWWYFGILVDGEYWILLVSTLIVMLYHKQDKTFNVTNKGKYLFHRRILQN